MQKLVKASANLCRASFVSAIAGIVKWSNFNFTALWFALTQLGIATTLIRTQCYGNLSPCWQSPAVWHSVWAEKIWRQEFLIKLRQDLTENNYSGPLENGSPRNIADGDLRGWFNHLTRYFSHKLIRHTRIMRKNQKQSVKTSG